MSRLKLPTDWFGCPAAQAHQDEAVAVTPHWRRIHDSPQWSAFTQKIRWAGAKISLLTLSWEVRAACSDPS